MPPRPRELPSTTVSIKAPEGTLFVTLTYSQDGEPLEVFVNAGKCGSDVHAAAEAIGRLLSCFLRVESLGDRQGRLQFLVRQLLGIGGGESKGFGPSRVSSMPDGIACALVRLCEKEAAE
jgi:hypothetical protein